MNDVGAVDLTPWKYRVPLTIVGLIVVVVVYFIFSPLGIASAGEPVVHASLAGLM